MSKLIAFSYSRLDGYETCPRRFHALNIAKSVKEEESEMMRYGKETHQHFAAYFKASKPLPLHLSQYTKYLSLIKQSKGEFIVEQQLAINSNYEGTGWFDKDVYCRVISDLTILNGSVGVNWDWKTGKPSKDFTQLQLSSSVLFMLDPRLESITHAFLWLKDKTVTREKMTRADIPVLWSKLLPRIQRYQDAHANQDFPPKPNYFCKGCPVKACQYWEARR